jgi:hypothetical protein
VKSNVSDHLEVLDCIYFDAVQKCDATVSDLRDLRTIRSRVKEEGFSFLTITLPQFCADFELALSCEFISPSLFKRFRKVGVGPSFLRGFLGKIFDFETGRIKNDPQCDTPTIIEGVRQICLAFKKVEHRCTPKRLRRAIESFISIEQELKEFKPSVEDTDRFRSVSFVLWNRIFPSFKLDDVVPKHGPGATSEGVSGNRKYNWRIWHDRLEPYFPFLGSGYSLSAHESLGFELVSFVPEELELPVRVVQVPKTLKAPRTIAVEPACMQYTQQGIRNFLYRKIESSLVTSNRVNFTRQDINQRLAMRASKSTRWVTIDLSDASDRVPLSLVKDMLSWIPDLLEPILACRSTHAYLPEGSLIGPLFKFASMGSALCFPIEAMYFHTLCVDALLRDRKLPVTFRNVHWASRRVFVYGDDIIVPKRFASCVLDNLQRYNCKVNASKTFVTGRFRESCGVDAYDGQDVTPVYIRRDLPKNRKHVKELLSCCSSANLFYRKGYWRTAELLHKKCEEILGKKNYPYVSFDRVKDLTSTPIARGSVMGRFSFLGFKTATRWNWDLQSFEVKAWVPEPVYERNPLSGYGALMKFFLSPNIMDRDDLHLERSALHGAVALKLRWVPTTLVGVSG